MLIVLRALFVLALGVVAITFIVGEDATSGNILWFTQNADLLLISCLGVALVVIAVDIFIPQKSLKAISGVFFGIVAGMVFAFGLSLIVDLMVDSLTKTFPELRSPVFADLPVTETVIEIDQTGRQHHVETTRFERQQIGYRDHPFVSTVKLMIGVICCYLAVSFVLQTKDDIRFVVPYVEFSKQVKGGRPLVLDTSAIIDGRVADLAGTGVFESELVVPRFVLAELQAIADSPDKLKRNRGRRGLDVLSKLQGSKLLDVNILNVKPEAGGPVAVDERLVDLAQKLDGRILTTDYNLNQVARVRGVDVLNLNDLANALKPIFLPGESLMVKVIKAGEEAGQGIGYLEDGTMVVVEGGRDHIGQSVAISVTSAFQTSAGRMIFGRPNGESAPGPRKARPTPPRANS
ncbi:MAG: TRAM domain-containing protein [Phycisphaerae bacterium]